MGGGVAVDGGVAVQVGSVRLPEGGRIPESHPLLWATSARVSQPGQGWLAALELHA